VVTRRAACPSTSPPARAWPVPRAHTHLAHAPMQGRLAWRPQTRTRTACWTCSSWRTASTTSRCAACAQGKAKRGTGRCSHSHRGEGRLPGARLALMSAPLPHTHQGEAGLGLGNQKPSTGASPKAGRGCFPAFSPRCCCAREHRWRRGLPMHPCPVPANRLLWLRASPFLPSLRCRVCTTSRGQSATGTMQTRPPTHMWVPSHCAARATVMSSCLPANALA